MSSFSRVKSPFSGSAKSSDALYSSCTVGVNAAELSAKSLVKYTSEISGSASFLMPRHFDASWHAEKMQPDKVNDVPVQSCASMMYLSLPGPL